MASNVDEAATEGMQTFGNLLADKVYRWNVQNSSKEQDG